MKTLEHVEEKFMGTEGDVDIVVDALVGTSLKEEIEAFIQPLGLVNNCRDGVIVDLPSGLSPDKMDRRTARADIGIRSTSLVDLLKKEDLIGKLIFRKIGHIKD